MNRILHMMSWKRLLYSTLSYLSNLCIYLVSTVCASGVALSHVCPVLSSLVLFIGNRLTEVSYPIEAALTFVPQSTNVTIHAHANTHTHTHTHVDDETETNRLLHNCTDTGIGISIGEECSEDMYRLRDDAADLMLCPEWRETEVRLYAPTCDLSLCPYCPILYTISYLS